MGLNLAAVRPTTFQLTNCSSFRVVKNLRHTLLQKPVLTENVRLFCVKLLSTMQ
jgi:hypothetical protein